MSAARVAFVVLGVAAGSMSAPTARADPMRPLSGAPATAEAPLATPEARGAVAAPARLSATRRAEGGPWEALVGTRWLRRGDRFEGALVEEIDANQLVWLRGGQRETLYLLTPLVHTPAARALALSPAAPPAVAAAAAPAAPELRPAPHARARTSGSPVSP